LTDLTADVNPASSSANGSTVVQWDWGRPLTVDQVTVGEAAFTAGPTASVEVDLQHPDGSWTVAARTASPVGDERAAAPYLLATFPDGETATAMRVVVSGSGGTVNVEDVHALGPAS
jgi:hypothetical protein